MGIDCQTRVRPAKTLRRLPEHAPLELCHIDRPAVVPVSVPRWDSSGRLPVGAAPQGARLPRVNLFIADDVGLGKTIEAGLIARELLLRKKAREIIVSCPPSMIYQWKDELENRFGLTFEVLDKDYMKQIRFERGFSVNPWSTHSRFLVSHRLLIDEAYAGPLRDWLAISVAARSSFWTRPITPLPPAAKIRH